MKSDTSNRSIIAVAGVSMQLALGAVYAWSVFRIPLTQTYGWTVSQVTLAFELAILVLGFAAFAGGLWMRRVGPRPVAILRWRMTLGHREDLRPVMSSCDKQPSRKLGRGASGKKPTLTQRSVAYKSEHLDPTPVD